MVLRPPLLWLLAGSKVGARGHSQPISSTICRKTWQPGGKGVADKIQEPDVCTPQAYALPPGAGCLGAAHGLYNIVFGQCLTGHQGTALYYEASQAVGQFAWGACAVSICGGFVNLSRSGVSASEVSKANMVVPQMSPVFALVARSQCVFFGAFCNARCLFLVLFGFPEHLLSSEILTRPASGSS